MRLPLCPPSFRPSLFTLVLAGSGLASLASLACNEAPLIAARDAGNPCAAPEPIYPCKAQDAGVPGCPASIAAATTTFGQAVTLSPGTYPNNCGVEVNSGSADQDNQCSQLGTCICDEDAGGGDGGTFAWTCYD